MSRPAVALLALSHVVDDLYQGAVPAIIPFLLLAYHYSYLAVTGITLAATLVSSVVQPVFGWLADRRPMSWLLVGGLLTAGSGIALSGLGSHYALIWLAVALSGAGVAAYHPEAARAVGVVGGDSAQAMSWFALGGNLGFAIGPVAVTAVLGATGLTGTPLLVLPAVAMAAVIWPLLPRLSGAHHNGVARPGGVDRLDDWRSFGWLTGVVICRSILFFGLSTFLELYAINRFHASHSVASAALTTMTVAGAFATIGGGWLADRIGRVRTLRLGYLLAVPGFAGVVLAPALGLLFVAVVICGIGIYLPFAVHTTLGQEYLPNRVGTASGVTLGLAVSAGGAATPLLGLLADARGLATTLAVLIAIPFVALLMCTRLAETRRPVPRDIVIRR
ncbi:MFS transporter [Nocardia sp. CDC160]|uniref:MFS transporter n=1 Tax=Nocardia sp. CDC160 TaxID=3112166 RepID=UPI002DBC9D75|nr:MFS transporter [Nocardia sp. CDC160]MEC3918403.1 MFS transporter [Nocardia sp. CDC160]MEC3919140.1 MFS transporter [Nocardia sp. CDC160]